MNDSHFGSQWAILKSNPSLVTNMSDSSLTSWTEGGGRAMATPMNPMTDEGEWPVRWPKWLWLTGGVAFLEPPDPPVWLLLLLLWLGTWGLSLPRSRTTRYPDDWKNKADCQVLIQFLDMFFFRNKHAVVPQKFPNWDAGSQNETY